MPWAVPTDLVRLGRRRTHAFGPRDVPAFPDRQSPGNNPPGASGRAPVRPRAGASEGYRMKRRQPAQRDGSFEEISDTSPDTHTAVSVEKLVQQIKETADKLVRDQANRGDVKLLSTALKELRYAFKVFAPYRD